MPTFLDSPVVLPRWGAMWLLAISIYSGLKLLTWFRCTAPAPVWKQAAYLFAWPGMDADAFLDPSAQPVARPSLREWAFAGAKTTAGLALLFVLAPSVLGRSPRLAAWLGAVGVVLVLHFGLFHLLSCLWRRVGVTATPIMNRPIGAKGLSEFWGRRWNLAFRDLAHRFVFRPLAPRFGASAALSAGFFASGLVHELVISLPAGAGWGGPTAYFVVQGAGVLAERSELGRRWRLRRAAAGRFFAAGVVLLPCPLLLHHPFMEGVMAPFVLSLARFP